MLGRRWCRFGTSNGPVCVTVEEELRSSQPITKTTPLSGTNVGPRLHVKRGPGHGTKYEKRIQARYMLDRKPLRQLEVKYI